MTPDDLEIKSVLLKASPRIEKLHAELRDAYPALRGTLAIPGMLVGHGLGAFVANGMTDDQIVVHVLVIVAQIRQALSELQTPAT